jgi:hypothetical protein
MRVACLPTPFRDPKYLGGDNPLFDATRIDQHASRQTARCRRPTLWSGFLTDGCVNRRGESVRGEIGRAPGPSFSNRGPSRSGENAGCHSVQTRESFCWTEVRPVHGIACLLGASFTLRMTHSLLLDSLI